MNALTIFRSYCNTIWTGQRKSWALRRKQLTPDAVDLLQKFDWPGNVRQLVNACRRMTITAPGNEIRTEDIPDEFGGQADSARTGTEWLVNLARWAEGSARFGMKPASPCSTSPTAGFRTRADSRGAGSCRRPPAGGGPIAGNRAQHADAQNS